MAKWQKVFSSSDSVRAEIVTDVLSKSKLKPVMINKKDSSYLLGVYEVHVLSEKVIQALRVIEDEISFA